MYTITFLHCVHEVAFNAVEDYHGEEHCYCHEDGTVEQSAPVEGAAAHAAVFEGLEDGGEWVQFQYGAVFLGGGAHGVDDWCGVHQQLYTEGYKLGEVAVFGGEGGYDESPRHGVEGYEQYE